MTPISAQSEGFLDRAVAPKMRHGSEPIPVGKRDQFRAARALIWWTLASAALWAGIGLLIWRSWAG